MITLPFLSAWIVMLVLGAAGHQLNQPKLYIGYCPMLLLLTAIYWLLAHVYTAHSNIHSWLDIKRR